MLLPRASHAVRTHPDKHVQKVTDAPDQRYISVGLQQHLQQQIGALWHYYNSGWMLC